MKINKWLCSLALATVSVAQLPLTAYAQDTIPQVTVEEEGQMNFSDVSPNHWAYRAIRSLVEEHGVIGGFPDGTFRGNRNLTRYEAAAMIAKVMERVETLTSRGGAPTSGTNTSTLDALRTEFRKELADLQTQVNRMSKDSQDMQADLDETRDMVEVVKDMLPKVTVFGDVAARMQGVTQNLANPSAYSTLALQSMARVGVKGNLPHDMDWFNFGARLTTSTVNDITNNFVSLGNLNQKHEVNFDQAYVSLKPWDGALNLTLGRHALPFVRSSELVFDDDVTLDGAFLKLRFGEKWNNVSLYGSYSMLNLGGYNAATPQFGGNMTHADTAGLVSGGGSFILTNDLVMFKLGGNYHQYLNQNKLVGKTISLNPMLNDVVGSEYVSNFNLATGTAVIALFPKSMFPFMIHSDVSYNTGAGANTNATTAQQDAAKAGALGVVVGVNVGKLKEAGNLMFGVDYKLVGRESVFSPFVEDQLGGSGVTAYEAKAGWQMTNNDSLLLTGQMATPSVAAAGTNPTYTLRGTLMHKF